MSLRQSRPFLALLLCLALGAGCTKSARIKSLLASAGRDFDAQRYDAAEVEYDAVRHLSYLNPDAIQHLGLIYTEEGRLERAYAYLAKAHEQDSNNPIVQLKLAQVALGVGRHAEAAALAAKYLLLEPTNEEALLILVDTAHTPAAMAAVRTQIESYVREEPSVAVFHAALGWVELRQKNPTNAEIQLQTALRLDPRISSAYLGMATLYSARDDSPGVEKALKTAADLSPLRSPTRLKYAEYKTQTGATNEAKQILNDITRQAPDFILAWNELMKIDFAERNYDDCAAVIAKILARDPSNLEAQMQSGNIALSKHNADQAVSQFERMDANFKNLPQVKYHLALAYLLKSDLPKATASLHATLAADHNFVPATLLLAELDLRLGEFPEAVTLLTQLIKSQPDNPKAHSLLATAYLAQRRPAQALEVYQQMAKTFPKSAQIPHLMGLIYKAQADTARARASFAKALELQPGYAPALEAITELDIADKRFAEARARVTSEIERDPKAGQPWVIQGGVYWAEGQTNQAESAFTKAIELSPDFPPAYLALAKLYLTTRHEDQALARLNTLVSKTNNAVALMEIGMIRQQQRQFDAARDAYEKVLALDPKFAPALNNLAYLYSEILGNLDRASQMAEKARELQPSSPFAADTLGWILFKQSQFPRALALLQEAAEKEPNDAEVTMHLGMAYYMMEDEDLARLYLQRAVDSPADFPAKEQARQSLAFLTLDPEKATPAMIEELQKRVRDNPRDPVPLMRLAAIEERRGDPAKAAESYQTLIKQNPKGIQPIIKLARLYAGPLKDPRQAMTLAKSAHDLAPNEPRAAALLGELIYQSGDYPWALSLLQQAAGQLTNQPPLLYDLAWAFYVNGREADADAKMEEAVAAGNALPNLPDARQFLALRAAAKDPAQARAAAAQVQAILQDQPRYLPALMVSALLHQQQGDAKAAADIYSKILIDYPLFTPAISQLAILYTQSGEDDAKAYDLAEKARASRPDDAALQRALGILAFRRGDAPRAKQLLQASEKNFSNDGELLYYLGMDYYKLKQRNDSKQTLQRALALTLPEKMAAEARRILAELK